MEQAMVSVNFCGTAGHSCPTSRSGTACELGKYVQVTLGITTLLTYVPAELGSAHQAGALALMTVMVSLLHAARAPAVRNVRWATPAAAAAVLAVGGAAMHFA